MNYMPDTRLPSAEIVFTSDGRVVDGALLSGADAAQRVEAEAKYRAYKADCKKMAVLATEARRRADGLCQCGRVHDRPSRRYCSVCSAQRNASRVETRNRTRRREIRLEVLREVEHEWICTKTSGTFTQWLRDQIRTGESA
jgi:hypothetical protein